MALATLEVEENLFYDYLHFVHILLDAAGRIHPYEHLAGKVTFATSVTYSTIRVFGIQALVEDCDGGYAGQIIFRAGQQTA